MSLLTGSRKLLKSQLLMLGRKPSQYGFILLALFAACRNGFKFQQDTSDPMLGTTFIASLFVLSAAAAFVLSCDLLNDRGLLDTVRIRGAWRGFLGSWLAAYSLLMVLTLAVPLAFLLQTGLASQMGTGAIFLSLCLFTAGSGMIAALSLRLLAAIAASLLADILHVAAVMGYALAQMMALWLCWDGEALQFQQPVWLVLAAADLALLTALLVATRLQSAGRSGSASKSHSLISDYKTQ